MCVEKEEQKVIYPRRCEMQAGSGEEKPCVDIVSEGKNSDKQISLCYLNSSLEVQDSQSK